MSEKRLSLLRNGKVRYELKTVLSGRAVFQHNIAMNIPISLYHRRRFPPEVIAHAVYLYHRFALSLRDVEDLLAERGVTVCYETIRVWCAHFGPAFARRLRKRQAGGGDHWCLDEMYFVAVRGERRLLWRAVDQDGDTLDILVQKRKDKQAALRFFKNHEKRKAAVRTD